MVGALVAGMVAGLWGVTGWTGFLYYLAMHAVVRPARLRSGLLPSRGVFSMLLRPCRHAGELGRAACCPAGPRCPPLDTRPCRASPLHAALLPHASRLARRPSRPHCLAGPGWRLAPAPAAPPPAAQAGGRARPPGLSGARARAGVRAAAGEVRLQDGGVLPVQVRPLPPPRRRARLPACECAACGCKG